MEEKENKNIELLAQELKYLRQEVGVIHTKLEDVLQNYVRREEIESRFERIQTEMDKRLSGAHDRIDKAVEIATQSREDSRKYLKNLSSMNGEIHIIRKEIFEMKNEYVQKLEKENEQLRDTNNTYKEKRFWILVSVVLFILGVIGIINADLIKTII